MSTMTFNSYMVEEAPRKVQWASAEPTEPIDRPLRVKTDGSNRNQVLLSLPRFRNIDILDLICMAEEKGKCRVSDRCSAIAVLVGGKPLDSAEFLVPLIVKAAPGMPKYL